jgi:hypothetical protein
MTYGAVYLATANSGSRLAGKACKRDSLLYAEGLTNSIRAFAHQKVPVYQEGDSGVQKPVAIGGSKAIPWRIVTAATGASLPRVPLGWGRRDQMDLREIGAHPPGITGQEGQLRNQGMGANEKVGKR